MELLRKENREYSELKEKNDELKRALNLKDEFGDYTITGANIIAIEPGNWFSVFKVDMGERDGIRADFPVVTGSMGLVGRVFDTDTSTSNIQTIIDEESAVSGWIAKPGGGHAIVKETGTQREGLTSCIYTCRDRHRSRRYHRNIQRRRHLSQRHRDRVKSSK